MRLSPASVPPSKTETGPRIRLRPVVFLNFSPGTGMGAWLEPAYKAAGAPDKLRTSGEKVDPEKAAAWLVR
jgi:hypothetical protein